MIIRNENKYGKYHGFTLVEILLALTISSVLVLGINAAYQQAYLIWSSTESKRPIYHATRLITETLRQEVSCLYIPSVTNEEDEVNSFFKLSYLPDQGTELTFYTLTPFWKGTLESSRIARVSYKFMKDSYTDENKLIRIEEPCGGDRVIGTPISDVIAENLSEFRVLAMDPNSDTFENSWKESYESKDAPPKALKVSLGWMATDKTPETEFEHCILISCDSPLL